jgi:hypothetical protein
LVKLFGVLRNAKLAVGSLVAREFAAGQLISIGLIACPGVSDFFVMADRLACLADTELHRHTA